MSALGHDVCRSIYRPNQSLVWKSETYDETIFGWRMLYLYKFNSIIDKMYMGYFSSTSIIGTEIKHFRRDHIWLWCIYISLILRFSFRKKHMMILVIINKSKCRSVMGTEVKNFRRDHIWSRFSLSATQAWVRELRTSDEIFGYLYAYSHSMVGCKSIF